MKSHRFHLAKKHLLRFVLIMAVAAMLFSGHSNARSFNPYLDEGRVAGYFMEHLQLTEFECNSVMVTSSDPWACGYLPVFLQADRGLLELAVDTYIMGIALELTGTLDYEVVLPWHTRSGVRLIAFSIGADPDVYILSYTELVLSITKTAP